MDELATQELHFISIVDPTRSSNWIFENLCDPDVLDIGEDSIQLKLHWTGERLQHPKDRVDAPHEHIAQWKVLAAAPGKPFAPKLFLSPTK